MNHCTVKKSLTLEEWNDSLKKEKWKELLQREKNKKQLLDFKLLEENYFPCGKKSEWDKKKCFALLTKKSKKKKKKKNSLKSQ